MSDMLKVPQDEVLKSNLLRLVILSQCITDGSMNIPQEVLVSLEEQENKLRFEIEQHPEVQEELDNFLDQLKEDWDNSH